MAAAYLSAKPYASSRRRFTRPRRRSTKKSRQLKLAAMGIDIDTPTAEQVKYMAVLERRDLEAWHIAACLRANRLPKGHPDKVADQISDAVLDAILAEDPLGARGVRDVRDHGTDPHRGRDHDQYLRRYPEDIVRQTRSREIGYDRSAIGFDAETCGVSDLGRRTVGRYRDGRRRIVRSPERPAIKRSVRSDRRRRSGDDVRLRLPRDRSQLMPLPITLAHELVASARRCAQERRR